MRNDLSKYNNVHWVDKLADWLEDELKKRETKDIYVFNGGLSVSGLQHIGRLRGEVILPEVLRRILEKRGLKIRQVLTLYTQDPWKGKKEQLEQFGDINKAKKYVGWPLIRVPDPKGCHSNWVEHYWSDFGPYIKEFTDGKIEVVYTHNLYRKELKEFAKEVINLKEKVRNIINKYRGRKPYSSNWIPIEPRCNKCGRIDSTEAIEVNNDMVRYRCRNCGNSAWISLDDSKLNWRVEWVGVWKVLRVDFEPYGKDHATPGGSRDSCVDLAINVFNFSPPAGIWYEWVSLRAGRKESDMTSSGFKGVTPKDWLEIAHPQILRFLYLLQHPQRRVVIDLVQIPQYYEQYYEAERIYFGKESTGDNAKDAYLSRTYGLSHPKELPKELPSQPPYTHMAILSQIIPKGKEEEALRRLKKTGHLSENPDEYSIRWTKELLNKARKWVEIYAPEHLRFKIPEKIPVDARKMIKDPKRLGELAKAFENLEKWNEEIIKSTLIEFGRNMNKKERREFYHDFYLAIIGRKEGPRAAPLLGLLSKNWVIKRLREASSYFSNSQT